MDNDNEEYYTFIKSRIHEVLLKITVNHHWAKMMELEGKELIVVKAEFADKMAEIIQAKFPGLLTDEEMEAIREDFLTQVFEP
jgi:hypothetical protein